MAKGEKVFPVVGKMDFEICLDVDKFPETAEKWDVFNKIMREVRLAVMASLQKTLDDIFEEGTIEVI